jgi:hypothetical protein
MLRRAPRHGASAGLLSATLLGLLTQRAAASGTLQLLPCASDTALQRLLFNATDGTIRSVARGQCVTAVSAAASSNLILADCGSAALPLQTWQVFSNGSIGLM